MPGRTREGARVSRLYKLKMQGRGQEEPKEEKKEKESKPKTDKKEDTKLDKVKKIFKDEKKKYT